MSRDLPIAGTLLCRLDDIADPGGKGFAFGEGKARLEIFVIRQGARAWAYINSCPHIGTPLDWREDQFLTRDLRHIVCGTHGAIFDIATGLCRQGPCVGRSLQPVAIAVVDGAVVLTQQLGEAVTPGRASFGNPRPAP